MPAAPLQVPSDEISVSVSLSPWAHLSGTACSSAANSSETGSSPRPANTVVGNQPDSTELTLVDVRPDVRQVLLLVEPVGASKLPAALLRQHAGAAEPTRLAHAAQLRGSRSVSTAESPPSMSALQRPGCAVMGERRPHAHRRQVTRWVGTPVMRWCRRGVSSEDSRATSPATIGIQA